MKWLTELYVGKRTATVMARLSDLAREAIEPALFRVIVDDIIYKDTVNYFNVSFRSPTKWLLRFMSNGKRKSVVTRVSAEEAQQLTPGFEVESAPAVFGSSRVYVDSIDQLWALKALVVRSLQILQTPVEEPEGEPTIATAPEAGAN